jgi:hypothetical protein
MAGHHHLDARGPEGFEHVDILLPRHAKDIFDPLILEGAYENIGTFDCMTCHRTHPQVLVGGA